MNPRCRNVILSIDNYYYFMVIDMSVDFECYKMFYYVVLSRNITKAAQKLSLTQPCVTKAIKSLEMQLGCNLLIRGKKGVTPTPEGEALFEKIRPACETILSAEEEITQLRTLQSGTVRLSCTDLAFGTVALPALSKFRAQYPGIKLVVNRLPQSKAAHNLSSGTLDLFVDLDIDPALASSGGAPWPSEENDDLPVSSVATNVLPTTYTDVPLVGRGLKHLAGHQLTIEELAKYPLIIPISDTRANHYYGTLLRPRGGSSKDIQVSGTDRQIQLTEMDFGVCFLPRKCVESHIEAGTIFPLRLDRPLPARHLVVMSSRGGGSFATERFIDLIREQSVPIGK